MLLDLPKNLKIKEFLDTIWNKIKILYNNEKKGPSFTQNDLQWQIVLQYLLLKSTGFSNKNEIYNFFNSRMEYSYEDQRIMNKFTQEQNRQEFLNSHKLEEAYIFLHYLEDHDYVVPIVLMRNIHTMKTDIELKILAEIFNYEFLYQESDDHTGAIYFSKHELEKKINENTKKKWDKLKKLSNDPEIIILYGQYHHWLAIRGIYKGNKLLRKNKQIKKEEIQSKDQEDQKIEDISQVLNDIENNLDQNEEIENKKPFELNRKNMIFEMNDPAISSIVKLNFNQLSENDRFYIFKKRHGTDYSIFQKFIKHIDKDIKEEEKRWNQYLEKKHKKHKKQVKPVEIKIDKNKEEIAITTKFEAQIKEILDDSIESLNNKHTKFQKTELNEELKIKKLNKEFNKKSNKKKSKSDSENYPKFWDMMDED